MIIAPMRATSKTSEATSKGTAHVVKSDSPMPTKDALCGSVPRTALIMKAGTSTPSRPSAARAARGHCLLSEVRGVFGVASEHYGEEKNDDNGPAVNQHLHQCQELGVQNEVYSGDRYQRYQQSQRRLHHVAGSHHGHPPPSVNTARTMNSAIDI